MGNAYRIMFGKPEGKRSHGRFRRKWESSIKMNLADIVYESANLIHLAQGIVVAGSCEHGKEPSVSIKSGEFLD
jgi:hypothetical protein